MKYYIINSEGKEVSFDLSFASKDSKTRRLEVSESSGQKKEYFVRSLAGKFFISENNQSWQKLPKITSKSGLVNINESLNVYRGFKPSGLSNANAGDLVTDMPGRIAKVMTTEGAVVQAGDTLVILEAMKMENEIKAGIDGIVKAVHVTEGQVLESGHLMIEIEE
ncbi:MAG: acetyl-CoA carboxylase biotin carboxyl carrier protein subunit [Bacteriovoracaceae bacterium]|jgi:biotin carboxyl carrier protein|nr:hypothetical protein [Halobacteriovoraceae bacterium]MDP7321722.1 acetyl-CoA carboxylase biotin carboxyl carrier protein subunit [Bacteriovoracaceae bacterium]|tara:strand:+ start:130 stop:624 length:495 start_codon:yes stop_codon:yes gene_type:complete